MLNTDVFWARVRSGCIIFLTPFENQFALHHVASMLKCHLQLIKLELPFTQILSAGGTDTLRA